MAPQKDNGATEKIAKSYGNKIKYIKKENGGVATALNLGIKEMTGEYFSWLSHDDLYVENRVAKMIEALSSGGSVTKKDTIVATSYSYFNKSGIFARVSPAANSHKYKHPLSFLYGGYINGCALIIPRRLLLEAKGFDKSLPTTQDFDLWFRLLRKHKLLFVDKELTLSRSHDRQGSKVMLSDHVVECDKLWIKMSNQLTDKEKSDIFGGTLEFYYKIYNFLNDNTFYEGAKLFLKKKMLACYKDQLFSGKSSKILKKIGIINKSGSRYIEQNKNRKTIYFPIFGDYNDRGGLNKMVAMLVNRMSKNYNVIVCSFFPNISGYELNEEVAYYEVSPSSTLHENIVNIALMFETDIAVVSHNCCLDGLNAISEMKKATIKVIAWNHEDFFLPYNNLDFYPIWSVRNEVFGKADAVVWLTNASSRAYSLINSNGLVIPNYIEAMNSKENTDPSIKINKKLIAIARFDDPRKRVNLLIDMYEKLLVKRPDISLMILGHMDLRMHYKNKESIGQAIRRINKKSEHIQVVGFVKDIERYYKQSDLNILPSYNEGFGLTILESALFSIPTAVFDNSGFDDIIDNGINGLIIKDGDTATMAELIADLYGNEEKLISMKNKSKDINKKFSQEKVILLWETVVGNILINKAPEYSKYVLSLDDMKKISKGYQDSLTPVSKRIESLSRKNIQIDIAFNDLQHRYNAINGFLLWRISKPIRLTKKVVISMKHNGPTETSKKIINKVNKRLTK
ncbi:MAG: glycosyltransferase [Candidatus Saccharibacteria bacterium]|nr:glycosyltransferase [Candidatus Saccharibacteria bacterium]